MEASFFEREHVVLGPYQLDHDAAVEARWGHDSAYQRAFGNGFVYPRTAAQIKKQVEELEKEADETRSLFLFAVRARVDDRLLGFARLNWLEWSHGSAALSLGIGEPKDRGQGFGAEVLDMMLHYAFDELNLFRLSAIVPEYNLGALRFFERAGFRQEARRRAAFHRGGRRWDAIHLGLLSEEWRVER
jgi:RimJ/RimL family protein N-acetyltransferase